MRQVEMIATAHNADGSFEAGTVVEISDALAAAFIEHGYAKAVGSDPVAPDETDVTAKRDADEGSATDQVAG